MVIPPRWVHIERGERYIIAGVGRSTAIITARIADNIVITQSRPSSVDTCPKVAIYDVVTDCGCAPLEEEATAVVVGGCVANHRVVPDGGIASGVVECPTAVGGRVVEQEVVLHGRCCPIQEQTTTAIAGQVALNGALLEKQRTRAGLVEGRAIGRLVFGYIDSVQRERARVVHATAQAIVKTSHGRIAAGELDILHSGRNTHRHQQAAPFAPRIQNCINPIARDIPASAVNG